MEPTSIEKTNHDELPPEDMTKYARNKRLYEQLKSQGLVVEPVYVDDDPERIDQLVVSVAFPPEVEIMTIGQAVEMLIERTNAWAELVDQPERRVHVRIRNLSAPLADSV